MAGVEKLVQSTDIHIYKHVIHFAFIKFQFSIQEKGGEKKKTPTVKQHVNSLAASHPAANGQEPKCTYFLGDVFYVSDESEAHVVSKRRREMKRTKLSR